MNYETGENESTPAVYAKYPPVNPCPKCAWQPTDATIEIGIDGDFADDSLFPITLEWWRSLIRPSEHPVEVDESGVYMVLEGGELNFPGCKTRGDARELCRLLGVELK